MVEVSDVTKGAIIITGVFGFMAISLMSLRLAMRKIRGQKFDLSDYATMFAISCTVGRIACTTVALLFANNNIPENIRAVTTFTDEDLYERRVGSQFTLADRGIYNAYIWTQKGIVLLLYQRMLAHLRWPERIIKAYWVILFLTQIGLQAATFGECTPVSLYWQVVPDPGTCVHAVGELYTLVVLNIVTDVMLILLPMPWLFSIKRSLTLRLQLMGLFSIGIGLVVIALCRLPIWGNTTSQLSRDTLGPIEGFLSAFVANIPTLFTLRHREVIGSTINTRKSSNVGMSGRTGRSGDLGYARDKFRQIHSVKGNEIMVTRDIEMVSNKSLGKEESDSHSSHPGKDSVEELIQ